MRQLSVISGVAAISKVTGLWDDFQVRCRDRAVFGLEVALIHLEGLNDGSEDGAPCI